MTSQRHLELTLIGAGDEADPASNSILQNTEAGNRVITGVSGAE